MHLSESQARRFAELFYSLLAFVDEEYDPLAELAELGGPDNPFDADYFTPVIITELCSYVFNAQGSGRRDGALDAYLRANPDGFSADDLACVASWRDAFNGAFFVVESSPESTILMGNGSLFSVTAVTRNACDVLGDAPALTVATLLPFEGAIVVAGSMPSYPLDQRSGLQDKVLLQARKLRAAGHICTNADELIREAPLLRVRNTKEHDDSVGMAVEDLVSSALEWLQDQEGGDPLLDGWGDDCYFGEPAPTHVGALSGLEGEARSAAVHAHFEEVMADVIEAIDEDIASQYFPCAPVRTLAGALDCRPLEELQSMARAMLRDDDTAGSKASLVAALCENFMLMSPLSAVAFLGADYEVVSAVAEKAWRAGGMVEMSRAEHDALPAKERWRSYDPFLNIFVWDDRVAAVVPDEIVAAMGERDWEFVRREQSYRAHARHLVNVYLNLCGVIRLEDLTALYLSYYPDEMSVGDFEYFIKNDGPSNQTRYDRWVYQGETYVIVPMLVERELVDELGPGEGAFIDGDELDELGEVTDEELFRRHLAESHQNAPWQVPSRTAGELEAYRVFSTLEELPSHRALQEYLDAHVPEGEDEYMYAEGVMGELVEMVQYDPSPAVVLEELQDMGIDLADIAGSDGMVSVITDFLNDIPRWALNGWTPKALMERKL